MKKIAGLTTAFTLLVLGMGPASATSVDCTIPDQDGISYVVSGEAFTGTDADEIICGTSGDDTINGGGGNDTIIGLDGIDTIDGGAGDDTIDGGAGDDVVTGGDGADDITSGDGDDTIHAGAGNDIVSAEAGDDSVYGDAGNDEITLGEGEDYSEGGAGADKLWGGDGADALVAGAGNDWVYAGEGDDSVKLDAGDDRAFGGPGADVLFGGDGKDALNAEAGSDSLDGGAGADNVNGGTPQGNDKDYCAKDKLDTQQNCFYDSKGPSLVSISVSPATIDTSESAQIIKVRARVKDAGAGVGTINFSFARLGANGSFAYNGAIWMNYWPGNWGCQEGQTPDLLNGSMGGMNSYACRISGDDLDGIYEFTVKIPKYTVAGTYVLVNGWINDAAGNSTQLQYDQLKKAKKAINFKQTGRGDGTAPAINSISVLTKTIDTSTSAKIVAIRVSVTDNISGLQSFNLSFMRQTNGPANGITFSWWNDGYNGNCVDGHAADPSLTVIMGNTSCKISGDNNSAIVELKTAIPAYSVKGTYILTWAGIRDLAGNDGSLMSHDLKKKKLAVNFKQVGNGDSSGPKLVSLKILTPHVDSGAAAQIVKVRARITDNHSGVQNVGLNFGRIVNGQQVMGNNLGANFYEMQNCTYTDGQQQCTTSPGTCSLDGTTAADPNLTQIWGGTACRISGTDKDGWYEFKFVLPAHAAAGTYRIVGYYGNDRANNSSNLWIDKLKKAKLYVGFTNG